MKVHYESDEYCSISGEKNLYQSKLIVKNNTCKRDSYFLISKSYWWLQAIKSALQNSTSKNQNGVSLLSIKFKFAKCTRMSN